MPVLYFLAEKLNLIGYEIYGIIRKESSIEKIQWIKSLIPDIKISFENLTNKDDVLSLISRVNPDEIYNFAGYTNIFNPWENLDLVYQLNCKIPQNILESIVLVNNKIKFFQASSCLVFGRTYLNSQNEDTPSSPIHPYGITKLYADNLVKEFRIKYKIFACSGIFFNHESERRGENFLTKKVTMSISNIVNLKQKKLTVGDIDVYKDMGCAYEFMDAVFLMMQKETPEDYVIGTGTLSYMSDFVKECFITANLNMDDCIELDKSLFREKNNNILVADIKKIKKDLNWSPKLSIIDIAKKMMNYELNKK